MLKKVSVDELRLGMYLHGLCGSWVEHPFWTSRFELTRTSDLALLRESSVRECWIGVSKGVDVAVAAPPPVEAPAPAPLDAATAVATIS